MNGTCILVFGPSGSGKGTLLSHIRDQHPEFVYPVSCTTREPRPGEQDGKTYHFLSKQAFLERVEAGKFVEWAEYGGNYYGTLVSEFTKPLERGETVVHELEAQGVRQLCEIIPAANRNLVFIDGGSWEALKSRIQQRGPLPEDELQQRFQRYQDEHELGQQADYVVENHQGDLHQAVRRLEQVVTEVISA